MFWIIAFAATSTVARRSSALWIAEATIAAREPFDAKAIKASKGKPQVVLLDIGLPGMNGYEVARAFRNDPEMSSCVLIALTVAPLNASVSDRS